MKFTIGSVLVTDTECSNPYKYRGEWYSGEARRSALNTFASGGDTTGMQLWYAPPEGGAKRIIAEEVAW